MNLLDYYFFIDEEQKVAARGKSGESDFRCDARATYVILKNDTSGRCMCNAGFEGDGNVCAGKRGWGVYTYNNELNVHFTQTSRSTLGSALPMLSCLLFLFLTVKQNNSLFQQPLGLWLANQ